ncbi:MAG: hypothetical protein F4Z04_06415 [Acidobacteria bacterium]|nr:hypothetical protein [Acidobacteriota bacterium]
MSSSHCFYRLGRGSPVQEFHPSVGDSDLRAVLKQAAYRLVAEINRGAALRIQDRYPDGDIDIDVPTGSHVIAE